MKSLLIAILFTAQACASAQEVFLGIPAAKNTKPDLTKFQGILDTKLLTEPIRPVDFAAAPNAWDGKSTQQYGEQEYLFNFASFLKFQDSRMLMMGARHPKTSRAKVLACITEMFRLWGPPAKYLVDDPDDEKFKDYLGFVWVADGAQVLLAFHNGEKYPWDGYLMASGAKENPEIPIRGETKGTKEIPRPADLKGMINNWLQKIPDA